MAYATYAEYQAETGLGDASGAQRPVIERILDAATQAINRYCNRPDGFDAVPVAVARYYSGSGKPYILIDECVSITTVSVKDAVNDTTYTAWDSPTTNMAGDGDWMAFSGDPVWPDFNTIPYTALMVDINGDGGYVIFPSGQYITTGGFRPSTDVPRGLPMVEVVARWGYFDTPPPDITEACLMQSARWYKLIKGNMARTLATTDLTTLTFPRQLDPDVRGILEDGRYVKRAIGRR